MTPSNLCIKVRLSEDVVITLPMEAFDFLKEMVLYKTNHWDNRMEVSTYEPTISFYTPPIEVPQKEQTDKES